MDANDQLHAQTALSLERNLLISFGWKAASASKPVSALWTCKKVSHPCLELNTDSLAFQSVT